MCSLMQSTYQILDPVQNDPVHFAINLFELEIPITIYQRDSLAFMWIIEISLVSPQKVNYMGKIRLLHFQVV